MTDTRTLALLVIAGLLCWLSGALVGWGLNYHEPVRDMHAGVTTPAVRFQP